MKSDIVYPAWLYM